MECDGKKCGQGTLYGRKYVCPHNNLEVKFPQLSSEWDPTNEKKMNEYLPGSHVKTRWICSKNPCGCHIWESAVYHRTGLVPRGCPYCNNTRLCDHNNLEYMYPELKNEWHPDNSKKMIEYSPGSKVIARWICSSDKNCGCHSWVTPIHYRTGPDKSGCPYCNSNRACIHNNLEINYPELKEEWHNENKNMNEYTTYSHSLVKWNCKNNSQHVWTAKIGSRTGNKKSSCPYCANNKTETKLFEYLTLNYDQKIEMQKKFDWCKNKRFLPFDICIEDLKLLIELDGPQHFEQISNWMNPILTTHNDKYKMKCANENGYSVIRLLQTDVWTDNNDWKNNLKKSIKKYDTPTNIFFGDCYDNHKAIDEIIDEVNDDVTDDVINVVSNTKKLVNSVSKLSIKTNNESTQLVENIKVVKRVNNPIRKKIPIKSSIKVRKNIL